MSATYKFSLEQLKALKAEHLINLARYYEIPITKDLERDKLIRIILLKQEEEPAYYVTPTPQLNENQMSVRVQRIKQSLENKNG